MSAARIIRISRGELPNGAWESVRSTPHPELAIYVRCYQGYFEASAQPVRRRELPSGDVALIISFGPRYQLIDPLSGGSLGTCCTFVAGLDDTYSVVDSTGAGVAMQIDFTPIGAHRVLQTPMHLLAHRTTELSDLLGSRADCLVEQLFAAPDWRSRFTILDAYLLSKIWGAPDVSREIGWVWRQLTINHGMTPISKLTGNLGWSREAVSQSVSRSYRRSAQDAKQGSPVPACARGAWFPSAVNASLVAAECGYSDQAHMIREFSALSGSTPIELVRRYSADGGIVEA